MTAASAIRERIATVQIVACRLAHERACWEDGRIVARQAGDERILVRELCGSAVRRRRLACAHTSARNAMEHALRELLDAGALSEDDCAAFLAELRAIGQQIHLLDHRKGDADKAYAFTAETARLTGNAGADAAVDAAKAIVRGMESEHDGYVEQLRDWRARVLAAVDDGRSRLDG